MRFWDSSAVVPLLVAEPSTPWARKLLRSDPRGIIWVLSPVEVRSALIRQRRDDRLTERAFREARARAERLFRALSVIVAVEPVRDRALRLLDLHELRAADALQLAAALIATGENPSAMPFVTLDQRLADAAGREGFPVEALP
jgi:predicted nucleic acid-binding protein